MIQAVAQKSFVELADEIGRKRRFKYPDFPKSGTAIFRRINGTYAMVAKGVKQNEHGHLKFTELFPPRENIRTKDIIKGPDEYGLDYPIEYAERWKTSTVQGSNPPQVIQLPVYKEFYFEDGVFTTTNREMFYYMLLRNECDNNPNRKESVKALYEFVEPKRASKEDMEHKKMLDIARGKVHTSSPDFLEKMCELCEIPLPSKDLGHKAYADNLYYNVSRAIESNPDYLKAFWEFHDGPNAAIGERIIEAKNAKVLRFMPQKRMWRMDKRGGDMQVDVLSVSTDKKEEVALMEYFLTVEGQEDFKEMVRRIENSGSE